MKRLFTTFGFSFLATFLLTIFINQVLAQTTWTTYSGATDTLPVVRASAAAFSIGDTGFVVSGGGVGYNSDGHKFIKSTGTWSSIANHPGSGLDGPVSFAIGDTGYLVGGSPGYYSFPTTAYKYDPHTDTWGNIADIPVGRQLAVAFVINGKAYVGGGFNGYNYNALNDFYVYDPANNTWTPIAPCPASGVSWLAVAFSINGKGYVGIGGHQATVGQPTFVPTNDFWSYDPSTDTWDSVAHFTGGPRMGAFAFANCNKGYVGTGVDDANQQQYHTDAWEFDPAAGVRGTWTRIPDFPGMARFKANAFVLGRDGYVCAGQNYTNNVVLGGLFKLSTVAIPAFTTGGSSSNSICAGQSVSFTDTSNFSPVNWQWSFPGGNPSSSNLKNPVIEYDSAGTYDVLLSAWNKCDSASQTFTKYVTVGSGGILTVTANPSSVCSGQPSVLTIAGGSGTYQWTPATGLTDSTSSSITVKPTATTTYNVSQAGGGSCASTGKVVLTVGNSSVGGHVTATRDTICAGTTGNLLLSNNSSNTIQWQSSTDGSSYADINDPKAVDTSKYRTTPLLQSTWYRATVGTGNCSAVSDSLELIVPPALTASFSYVKSGKQVTFDSKDSKGNISSYFWDFGDNQTDNTANPVHNFAKDTLYNVCLTIYDGSNCSYTFCREVDLTTGVTTIDGETEWSIYPNPFTTQLTITGKTNNDRIAGIELYNMLGQQLLNYENPDKAIFSMDVTALAKGMYFLRIRTMDSSYLQKVIKQ